MNRLYRIKKHPARLGGGWSLQLIEDGQIIMTRIEPENHFPQGLELDGLMHKDLSLLACQLDGAAWSECGVLP